MVVIDKNSPIPQYFQLQTWLIEQIEQGLIKPNERIPTEEELAQATGLARATIRQALQNLVNMGYLVRRRRLGTFVLDRNSDGASQPIVGVLIPDIRSGYTPELARGIGDEAAKNEHSMIICNTDDSFARASAHVDRLIEHTVSGVIFVPIATSDDKNRSLIAKLSRKSIPVVLADRPIPDMEIDCVTTDNHEGAYKLTKYLLTQGHERIAILLNEIVHSERRRLQGYKSALSESGLPIDDSLVYTRTEPYNEQNYIEDVRSILHRKKEITAIFAGHDRLAYLFCSVASGMGIDIPNDISIVGYDDLSFTDSHPVSLTTMHQPIYEMGQESMRLLMSRLHGNDREVKTVTLRSYLVERSSVKKLTQMMA